MNKIENKEGKKEELLKALGNTMGNITAACKTVGISSRTFYYWKEEDSIFAEKIDNVVAEQKIEMDDFAEGKLYQHIKDGNIASLIFYLKTRHPSYRLKQLLELKGKIKTESELSEEERELVKKAIQYAAGKPSREDNK